MYLLIFIGIVILCYFLKPYIQSGVEWVIGTYSEIDIHKFRRAIFPAFVRVIVLNWYNYLVLLLIWLLLFLTEVVKDIIDSYLGTLIVLKFGWIIVSCLSLFF